MWKFFFFVMNYEGLFLCPSLPFFFFFLFLFYLKVTMRVALCCTGQCPKVNKFLIKLYLTWVAASRDFVPVNILGFFFFFPPIVSEKCENRLCSLRWAVVVCIFMCLCWAGLFAESSWLPVPVPTHSAHWQPGGRAAQCVPTQLPIERQRYGHNVSDRLAVSTAPPFLLLWSEINHKYPPCPCPLMAQPHQTPSGTEKEGRYHFLAGIPR